jgi:hypothetical protein
MPTARPSAKVCRRRPTTGLSAQLDAVCPAMSVQIPVHVSGSVPTVQVVPTVALGTICVVPTAFLCRRPLFYRVEATSCADGPDI